MRRLWGILGVLFVAVVIFIAGYFVYDRFFDRNPLLSQLPSNVVMLAETDRLGSVLSSFNEQPLFLDIDRFISESFGFTLESLSEFAVGNFSFVALQESQSFEFVFYFEVNDVQEADRFVDYLVGKIEIESVVYENSVAIVTLQSGDMYYVQYRDSYVVVSQRAQFFDELDAVARGDMESFSEKHDASYRSFISQIGSVSNDQLNIGSLYVADDLNPELVPEAFRSFIASDSEGLLLQLTDSNSLRLLSVEVDPLVSSDEHFDLDLLSLLPANSEVFLGGVGLFSVSTAESSSSSVITFLSEEEVGAYINFVKQLSSSDVVEDALNGSFVYSLIPYEDSVAGMLVFAGDMADAQEIGEELLITSSNYSGVVEKEVELSDGSTGVELLPNTDSLEVVSDSEVSELFVLQRNEAEASQLVEGLSFAVIGDFLIVFDSLSYAREYVLGVDLLSLDSPHTTVPDFVFYRGDSLGFPGLEPQSWVVYESPHSFESIIYY